MKFKFNMRYILTFLSITALLFFTMHGTLPAACAFQDAPAFEVEIGDESPEQLGQPVDEEKITDYDKFYYPASFGVFENFDLVLVLDSIKNRICAYSLKGKFRGELKLGFNEHPVDFAWYPASKRIFVIFQGSPDIGIIDGADLSSKISARSFKTINVLESLGLDGIDKPHILKFWPCEIENTDENNFILNLALGPAVNLALSYKNGKIVPLKPVDPGIVEAAGFQGKTFAFDLHKGFICINQNLRTGGLDFLMLLKELSPARGFACRFTNIIGADAKNNFYIGAYMGAAEDGIETAYAYKFDETGKFIARAEMPASPGMLANRFISVDADGALYYMRRQLNSNRISFYKLKF